MRKFFSYFFVRTLRFEILTIFLALISLSSIVILGFTYVQDSKVFDAIFYRSMHRLGSAVGDRTSCLLGEYQRVPKLVRGFVQQNPTLTIQSKELIDYFLNLMSQQSNLSALFLGLPNGDALVMDNLQTTSHPDWFSTDELAPEGTVFAYLLLDHSKPVAEQETWHYLSKDFTTLAVRSKAPTFDLPSRPWYQGAEKTGQLFWTDLYTYALNEEVGISCSVPIYDPSKRLMGVVGTDVSLYILSNFISAQKIGQEGKAYICDSEGKIITPTPDDPQDQKFVSEAFSHVQEQPKHREFAVDFQATKYLVSIHDFPLSATKRWYIVLFDPKADLFQHILEARRETILISLAILFFASLCVVYFSKRISKPIVTLSQEIDKITHLNLDSELRVPSMIKEVHMLDTSIAAMRYALRSFSRYVPKSIVLDLMQKGQEIALGGEKRELTIFFSDIEDFTSVSETFPVDKITDWLEEYFRVLSETILAEQGTIDKYIGDGVMAFWGAPTALPGHADLACEAALKCQERLQVLNQKRIDQKLPPFFTRIGINTGTVFVGNIGTTERMDYTVIGDAVNLASRLEELNKVHHTKILIGEETKVRLSPRFTVRSLGLVEVRGKKERMQVYELLSSARHS